MPEHLSLNPQSGFYEATIIIKIDAEIFQRAFFRHVEEHHVDLTNPEAMQEAIQQVAKVTKWLDHPRTQKVCSVPPTLTPSPPTLQKEEEKQEPVIRQQTGEEEPLYTPRRHHTYNTIPNVPRKKPHHSLSAEDRQALIERAMALPVDRWDEALTPIPEDLPRGRNYQRGAIYRLRHTERYELEQLKNQLEPAKAREDTLVAVADAVNGARIK